MNQQELQQQIDLVEQLLVDLPPEAADRLNTFFTFVGKTMMDEAVHASSWDQLLEVRSLGYYLQGPLSDIRGSLEDARAKLEELRDADTTV